MAGEKEKGWNTTFLQCILRWPKNTCILITLKECTVFLLYLRSLKNNYFFCWSNNWNYAKADRKLRTKYKVNCIPVQILHVPVHVLCSVKSEDAEHILHGLHSDITVFHCKEIRIMFDWSDFVVGNLSLIVCHTLPDDSNLCMRIALGGERVHVKLDNWHLLTV